MLVCLFYLPCLLALSSKYLHLYSVNACCPSQLEDIVGHTPDTRGISQMKQTISTIHNEKIIVTAVSAAKAKIKNGQLSGGDWNAVRLGLPMTPMSAVVLKYSNISGHCCDTRTWQVNPKWHCFYNFVVFHSWDDICEPWLWPGGVYIYIVTKPWLRHIYILPKFCTFLALNMVFSIYLWVTDLCLVRNFYGFVEKYITKRNETLMISFDNQTVIPCSSCCYI